MTHLDSTRRALSLWMGAGIVGVVPARVAAQFRVEVTGVGLTQLPIALPKFRGEDAATQAISAIVNADLERSGRFRSVPPGAEAIDESSRLDFAAWRKAQADALVAGSVSRLVDGRFDVRYRLWDVVRGAELGGQSFAGAASDLRYIAHKIADAVYERLTGERGVFATRIAYVTKNGSRFALWVADADGENAQAALNSVEPIISPSWSPNGAQLAYVSFESRKPVVYVHDVASGKRRLLASFRGSNSAPRFSPDGRRIALTLSRDGGSQVFLMDANGGEPKRITQGGSIDTEAVFAPDGSSIYFVSDRGGSPQIYRQALSGGEAQRVTFNTPYNISPAISPDGKQMAHIVRANGGFRLHLTDLSTGQSMALTDSSADERPSFAPNGRLIAYASRQDGKDALMTTTLDGKVKARLAGAQGDLREPDWGPYIK